MVNTLLVAAIAVATGSGQLADTLQHAPQEGQAHRMFVHAFDSGWRIAGMAQLFPIASAVRLPDGGPLEGEGFYLTQPAAMINLESPRGRFALRFTPNFEFATLDDGEQTPGAWGEGFIDSRHPHTAVHELMLSVNGFDGPVRWSLSAGKGFAPFGTEDPMSRPAVKYPTNHHLSQILERFTVNGIVMAAGWSLEAGVFGGAEPDGPWDFTNVSSFGDSYAARLTRRVGEVNPWGAWPLEVSASWAEVTEEHHGREEARTLLNGALRIDRGTPGERLYALLEASRVDTDGADEDFWSVLAEARLERGRHQPYVRGEWATRPEYPRDAASGPGFFRYDHDAHVTGSTRWSIFTVGYGYTARAGGISIRPFVEGQLLQMAGDDGRTSAAELLGDTRAWGLTAGARIYLGGDAMRMGTYGILDPMTLMGRGGHAGTEGHDAMHHREMP